MKKIISIAILLFALVFVYESWLQPEYQSVGGQFKIMEKKGD